jgi:hypothetical protein
MNMRSLEVHPEVLVVDAEFRSASAAAEEAFSRMDKGELKMLHENFMRAAGGAAPKRTKRSEKKSTSTHAASAPHPEVFSEKRKVHPNAYKPWKDADDVQLRKLYLGGTPRTEIALELGRNAGAIRSRLVHLGLLPR